MGWYTAWVFAGDYLQAFIGFDVFPRKYWAIKVPAVFCLLLPLYLIFVLLNNLRISKTSVSA